MAELGDLLSGLSSTETKIEVEMLDYDYVSNCNDWKQVHAILTVLRSGNEGHYPDLEHFVEQRLIALLPEKEKKKYLAMHHKTSPSEVAAATADISKWLSDASQKDEHLMTREAREGRSNHSKVPAVRGNSGNSDRHIVGDAETKLGNISTAESSDESFMSLLSSNQRRKIEKLMVELNIAEMSDIQRKHKSSLEKTKGNESFRVSDNKDAVLCYSRSIAYDASNAVVWANRAMAYIRLELFDLAEADSSVAVHLDSRYTKAYSRRGLVRFKRGKYADAIADFKTALSIDPTNQELLGLLNKAKEKYLEVEGRPADEDDDVNDAAPVVLTCKTVSSPSELLLPTAAFQVLQEGIISDASGFVRITIADDDSDSDSDDFEAQVDQSNGFHRVVISDATESDDEKHDSDRDNSNEGSEELNKATSVESESTANTLKEERNALIESKAAANTWKEEGNALMAQRKFSEAIEAYTMSLSFVTDFVPSLNNRAQAYLMTMDYDRAISDASQVLSLDGVNLKALFRRASAYYNVGMFQGAASDVELILLMDATNEQALQLKDLLSHGVDHVSGTVPTAVKTEVSRDVEAIDVEKLKITAQQYLADGLNDKVIALLAKYLRSTDTDSASFSYLMKGDQTSLLHLLAAAYSFHGDHSHAVATYERILQIDSTNFRALLKRADSQLKLAEEIPAGMERDDALKQAESDISAALVRDAYNVETLLLRQTLLKVRNTDPGNPSSKGDQPSGIAASRQQSDAEKELGNNAMAEKNYATACTHYTNAITFDSTNMAAYNNRSLARLKQGDYISAESDASMVIDFERNLENQANKIGVQSLIIKALCRRAQARRGLADTHLQSLNNLASSSSEYKKLLFLTQDKLREAQADVQTLLRMEPNNKVALADQKAIKDSLKSCQELLSPVSTVGRSEQLAGDTKQPVTAAASGRLNSMLGASQVSSSFDTLGMVARSVRKYNTNSEGADPPAAELPTVINSPKKEGFKPTSGSKQLSTPKVQSKAASKVLSPNSLPEELPKTVYEFERVWRGLKDSPALFATYLSGFKKSTFRKVVKDSTSPDLVSFMWSCMQAQSPIAQIKFLTGFSSIPNFPLMLSLLPGDDLQNIQHIFNAVQRHTQVAGDSDLSAAYQSLCLIYNTTGELAP